MTQVVEDQIRKEEACLKFWQETLDQILSGGIVELDYTYSQTEEKWSFNLPSFGWIISTRENFRVGSLVEHSPGTGWIIIQGHHISAIKQKIRETESGLKYLKTVHG